MDRCSICSNSFSSHPWQCVDFDLEMSKEDVKRGTKTLNVSQGEDDPIEVEEVVQKTVVEAIPAKKRKRDMIQDCLAILNDDFKLYIDSVGGDAEVDAFVRDKYNAAFNALQTYEWYKTRPKGLERLPYSPYGQGTRQ